MQITERDIFDYVYDKENLAPDKCSYIELNSTLFSDIINFYESFKNSYREAIPPSVEESFNAALRPKITIELFPVMISNGKQKVTRFAAGSLQNDQTVKALSFTDKDSTHIIRVLFFPDKTELFVLAPGDNKLENFSLVAKPSLKEYYFKDSSHSITTDEKVIDQIDILYH